MFGSGLRIVRLVVLSVAPALLACGTRYRNETKPISDWGSLAKLEVVARDGGSTGRTAQLMLRAPVTSEGDKLVCPTLPAGTVGTLNGKPLTLIDAGRGSASRSGDPYCTAPTFEIGSLESSEAETANPDIFTITDHVTTLTMAVAGFTARRTVKLTAPASGQVKPNDVVTLAIAPARIPITKASIAFTSNAPTQRGSDGLALPEFRCPESCGVDVSGNTASFRFNTSPPGPGHLSATFDVAFAVTQCEGPKECTVDVSFGAPNLPLTVAP